MFAITLSENIRFEQWEHSLFSMFGLPETVVVNHKLLSQVLPFFVYLNRQNTDSRLPEKNMLSLKSLPPSDSRGRIIPIYPKRNNWSF